MEPKLRRLQRIEIDGLFGIYNHRIDLNEEDRVTLLHGPNGVGKTTTLRMVDALLRRELGYFVKLPFSRFHLRFDDCCILELQKPDIEAMVGDLSLEAPGRTLCERVSLDAADDSSRHDEGFYEFMETLWQQGIRTAIEKSDEALSRTEPASTVQNDTEALPWFDEFRRTASTHFIPSHRLFVSSTPVTAGLPIHRSTARVLAYARDLKKRLDDTMAEYGRDAQALDQTFPRRLVSAKDGLDHEVLERRLAVLAKKAADYRRIGILGQLPEHPFDAQGLREIDSTGAKVMTLYVEDTERKLRALEDLASRARFLLDSINGKYRNKEIRLDRDQGLVAERGDGRPLALDSLSSGEQHELVLHYDLLFGIRPNTVVLIDEPELSLHVTWQKRFLPELIDIVQLSGFDVLVATHSPFIVGEKDELMVGLGESA